MDLLLKNNRVDYLKEAIDSVLRQTFTDFEIIVVLDHCTDDTRHELNKLKLSLLNQIKIRVFENTQEPGANVCRNLAAENAVGDWLAFLDDDDLWLPNKLEIFQDLLQGQNNLAGRLVKSPYRNYYTISKPQRSNLYFEIFEKNFIGGFSSLTDKDLYYEIGGVDQNLGCFQDYEFYLRCFDKTNKVSIIDKPVVIYSQHFGIKISNNFPILFSE